MSPARSASRLQLRAAAGLVLLSASAVAIWLANLSLQIVGPITGLDGSWQVALNDAWLQRLVFGRDVVWTYGPWGWLTTIFYFPATFGAHIAWDLAFKALFASLVVAVAPSFSWPRRIALIASSLLIVPLFADTLPILLIAGVVLWLTLVQHPPRKVVAAAGAFLGFLSLQKFTFFLMIAGSVGLLAFHLFPRGAARTWFCFSVAWAASVLVFWLLASQDLAAFPLFVQRSAILAAGYTEAMFFDESPLVFRFGLATALLFLVLVWDRPRTHRLARALLLSAYGFLAWKHGFVRADGHTFGFFSLMLFAGIALPHLTESPALRLRVGSWLLCGLALCGATASEPGLMRVLLPMLSHHLADRAHRVVHLREHRAELDAQLATERATIALPRIRARVGDATVDQFGYEQSILLFNGLNYRPRPVLQSYQVYSGPLAALNADFYRSSRAPDFTIARLQSIDGRFPALDDAALLPCLLTDHDFVLSEKDALLLQRHSTPAPFIPSILTSGRLRYASETATLPADVATHAAIWAKIDAPFSALGWLRTFFYKPPEIVLVVTDFDAHDRAFRLVVPAARAGFLLSPLLLDTGELEQLLVHRTGRPAKSFRVEIPRDAGIFFLKRARYEIFSVDGLTFHPATGTPP